MGKERSDVGKVDIINLSERNNSDRSTVGTQTDLAILKPALVTSAV